jgi:hypothetical protein
MVESGLNRHSQRLDVLFLKAVRPPNPFTISLESDGLSSSLLTCCLPWLMHAGLGRYLPQLRRHVYVMLAPLLSLFSVAWHLG